MDTIPSDPQTNELIRKYGKGALDIGGALLHGLGSQVLSGYAGLAALPHGMDAAADAVRQAQGNWGVHDLSPEGIDTIKAIAPAYRAVASSPVGKAVGAAGEAYNDSVNNYADLASKYLSPEAGAQVAAAGAALPQAFVPGGAEAKGAEYALEQVAPKAAEAIPHTVSMEAAGEGYQPTARAVVARHPETGQELGRMTMQPRGGVMTGIRSDVAPEAQGQGIGTKLLQRGIDHAYENGMDFGSDTSVTPGQMHTYLKMRDKGYPVDINPNAEEWDSPDGPALRSTNGAPVVSVRRPTAAPDALPDDNPPAMVVPHRNGFGAMMNGQVLSTHGDQAGAQSAVDALNAYHNQSQGYHLGGGLGDLVKQFAPEAETIANHVGEHGGVTYNPTSGDIHSAGYVIPSSSTTLALDAAPTPDDVHDFMMQNQGEFDDPNSVLHVHSDNTGNHFMHVAKYSPDFGHAADISGQQGLPGFADVATGELHGSAPNTDHTGIPESHAVPDPDLVQKYLAGAPQMPTPWTPGEQTVANPKRNALGAPKLEILSTQIGKLAQRLGVSPETARDLVISGKAGAFAEGGSVAGPVLSGLADLVAKYAPDMKPITNTIYRGTEGGTPGAALRKSSDGEIGPGIYYTPHKWLAASYGGGPKASVKAGTRVVHEATVDNVAPEHVAYAWQPQADAGTGAPTYITSHTGDLLHTYDPLGNTPEAVQSRMAIPGVMQKNGVKMIVGHDDSIAGNQISVIDPSILKLKDPESTAGKLPPSSQSTP